MQILIDQPLRGTEAVAFQRLYERLKDCDGLLIANFHLGPRQIDFVVVLPTYTAIIELKSLKGPAFGGQNGDWAVRDLTGEKRAYPGLNPWRQAEAQSKVLSDEMSRFQRAYQTVPTPLNAAFYKEVDTFACIYPLLHSDSQLNVTAFKAEVIGFDTLLQELRSRSKATSWSVTDWKNFAENSLKLHSVSLWEALDARLAQSRVIVDSYLHRLQDVYSCELAPLPMSSEGTIRGSRLIEQLMEPTHQLLVGPSGSCKTFHLRHFVIAASSSGSEVPIPVDPKGYTGGDFAKLLQQCVAPFTNVRAQTLIADIANIGLEVVLVVDGLNECPETTRSKLLEKLQAFALTKKARIVISDQANSSLPSEIRGQSLSVALPAGNEKAEIFSFHAGGAPLTDVSHLSRSFTNAFDLKLAGRLYARGDSPKSRWDLYGRYVRDALGPASVVASALLRTVAREMMESLSMAISRTQFETFGEAFYRQEQTPLAALDRLLQSRLILSKGEYIVFEHEALLGYFETLDLVRSSESFAEMAVKLSRPRNVHLLEFALGQCEDASCFEALLPIATDPKLIGLALRGNCGSRTQDVVRKHCLDLLALGLKESSTMVVTCRTFERESGTKVLLGLDLKGNRPLSPYGALLCSAIADNLDDEEIGAGCLALLQVTDTVVIDSVKAAAIESGVSIRGACSEALRSYGGFMLYGPGTPFVCSGILSAIRYSRMMCSGELQPLPILRGLVDEVNRNEQQCFSFFTLVLDLQRNSTLLSVDELIQLADKAWNTGVGWLRMETVRMLSFLHRRAASEGESQVIKIRELLQSFETQDVLVNTEILEALVGYDGLELALSVDDACAEMCDIIDSSDEPSIEQAATAEVLGTTWAESRRDAAYTSLSKIFEDVFLGVYSEAFDRLSVLQRKKILEMAATSSSPGFNLHWILWQLLPIAGPDTLPIFEKFVTGIGDSATPQETVGAFLVGVQGYAHLSNEPPPLPVKCSDDQRAWAVVSNVLYWALRSPRDKHTEEKIALEWKILCEELPCCLPDILEKLNSSQWMNKEDLISLTSLYPSPVRKALHAALSRHDSLTSLFRHGGSSDANVLNYSIKILQAIGNLDSLPVLEGLTESPKIGREAVQAIHAIRSRSQ